LDKLAQYTEKEILNIHGIGPKSIPALKNALHEAGLSFRDDGKLVEAGALAGKTLNATGAPGIGGRPAGVGRPTVGMIVRLTK
jgi:hypothetical protein